MMLLSTFFSKFQFYFIVIVFYLPLMLLNIISIVYYILKYLNGFIHNYQTNKDIQWKYNE